MLDVDFGFFGCLSLSFEFGLPHPHPHPKLNFFWVPVSDHRELRGKRISNLFNIIHDRVYKLRITHSCKYIP
jgi:hypothetical protein